MDPVPEQSGGVDIWGSVGSVSGDIVGGNKGIPPDLLPAIIASATGDWKRLTDELRQAISELEERLGVGESALQAFFRILGEAEVPPERQEARLVEIAEHYRNVLAQLAAASGDDPKVAKLKAEATVALEAGKFGRADELLARVQAAQDAALDRQQLEAAATAAQRGQLALTRLRYREAAGHFAAAARRVPPGHEEQASNYLDQESFAFYGRAANLAIM